ncbi:MAG TPA: NigD-like protein [Dysgonamonadaceae bacterium]|nr:NigD-like protein [Dysgonamonadaceae bacterium]
MFKKKTIFKYAALLLIILSTVAACNDSDGYSLGDFRISIATVVPEGQHSYSLLLDNGDKLWPAATDVYYRPRVNQRVFVNYTILSDKIDGFDHYIKVNDIWNVLTKSIIELNEENADSIGNDPVRVNEFWIGDDYLNVSFSFNYGGIRPHAINMVQNKMDESDNEADVLELEFRHNSYESPRNSLYDGFAAFDLRPFRKDDENSIPIIIKYKDWEGDKIYELVYKYNDLNKNRAQISIPNISSNEYE